MGERGPIGKRSEARRRRNKTDSSGNPNEPDSLIYDPDELEDRVDAPDPDPNWHVLALMLYERVKGSAVSLLYEPSDWGVLFVALDQLSRNLQPQPIVVQSGPRAGEVVMVDVPMNGATFGALNKVFASLMLTEGDRRRLKLEVERRRGSSGAGEAGPTGDNVIDFRRERFSS